MTLGRRTARRLGLAAFALLAAVAVAEEAASPPPTSWFVDRAGLVSATARQAFDHRLAALEERNGVRLVVVVEPRLPPDVAIEDYTLRAVEGWTVWRKDQPALAWFIFPESRRTRIEVGYGAEGAVTDLEARRILDEVVAPAFRKGDYEGGIARALDALDTALAGELPPPRKPRSKGLDDSFVIFLIVLVVLWLIVLPLVSRRRRRGGLRRIGSAPWVVGGPWTGSGGWGGGGRGGGGGSVFGGGGFSGGGNVFGGGGASGDW